MRSEPKTIAVFRLGHIGDTVVALPALWTVRKQFPKAQIIYLTQENRAHKLAQGMEVLRPGTVYDELMVYKLGAEGVSKWEIIRTLLNLRLRKIDMLVYLAPYRTEHQLARDAKFFQLSGIKNVVGMEGHRETDYHPKGTPLPPVGHEADVLLKHLARDGVAVPYDQKTLTDLCFSDEERLFARTWMASHNIDLSHPVIAIAPCSKMPSKVWPIERFVEVMKSLESEFGASFIAFGGPSEFADCKTCCDSVTNGINTSGTLTVRQSAAIMELCHLYVGVDTGPMHLAATVGLPCVGIFAALDWRGRWYPYGTNHIVLRETVPCEGCMLEVCDKDNECLKLIQTGQVLASIRKVLRARISES